jgi:hypothetical protein
VYWNFFVALVTDRDHSILSGNSLRAQTSSKPSMSLDIQADPPATEVQILRRRYGVVCRARSCRARPQPSCAVVSPVKASFTPNS